ncbi:MAG: hypothetical protein ACLFST_07095 [Spirochaetia bacterium]
MKSRKEYPVLLIISFSSPDIKLQKISGNAADIFPDGFNITPYINSILPWNGKSVHAPLGRKGIDHRAVSIEEIEQELNTEGGPLLIPLQPDTGREEAFRKYTEDGRIICTHIYPVEEKPNYTLCKFRFIQGLDRAEGFSESYVRGILLAKSDWINPKRLIRLLKKKTFSGERFIILTDIAAGEDLVRLRSWISQLSGTRLHKKMVNGKFCDFKESKYPLPPDPFVYERAAPRSAGQLSGGLEFDTPYEPVAGMTGDISINAGGTFRFKKGTMFPPTVTGGEETDASWKSSFIITGKGELPGFLDSAAAVEGDLLRGIYALKTFSGPGVLIPGHLKLDCIYTDEYPGIISRWEVRQPEFTAHWGEVGMEVFSEIPLFNLTRDKKIEIDGEYPGGGRWHFEVTENPNSCSRSVELFGQKIVFRGKSGNLCVGIYNGRQEIPALPVRLYRSRQHTYLAANPGGAYRSIGKTEGKKISRFVLSFSAATEEIPDIPVLKKAGVRI